MAVRVQYLSQKIMEIYHIPFQGKGLFFFQQQINHLSQHLLLLYYIIKKFYEPKCFHKET